MNESENRPRTAAAGAINARELIQVADGNVMYLKTKSENKYANPTDANGNKNTNIF